MHLRTSWELRLSKLSSCEIWGCLPQANNPVMFDHLFYPSLSPSTLIVHITHSSDLFRNNLVMCTQIETSVQCLADTSQLTGMAIDLVTQIYTLYVDDDHHLSSEIVL